LNAPTTNEIARAKAGQNRHQLRFTVKDVAATLRNALANGGTLLNDTTEQAGAKIASVRDPDGNSIEFIQTSK
jgi:predicted enzyme related to lactoylglutathione lyase